MLTNNQKAHLKSLASKLNTIIQVGKNGVNPELVLNVEQAIKKKELIKIAVLNNCEDDIKNIASTISERTRSEVVQIIGKKIVLYRASKNNIISFDKNKILVN